MAAPRIPINALPDKTSASPTDLLVVQDGSVTKKMTMQHLYDGVGVSQFTSSTPGTVPASGGGVANYLRADGSWTTPPGGGGGGGGGNLVDGDYGDITVGGAGTTMFIDSQSVTNAKLANMTNGTLKGRATTGNLAPEDLNATQVKTLLAITQADVAGLSTALTAKANTATTIPVTTPITGGGTLGSPTAIGISDFTVAARGAVPSPGGTTSGRFLKDDGSWAIPPSAVSAASGVFPFQYSATITEPPTGSQLRGNASPLTTATKLWVTEATVDGLNVAVGLGRIKNGFQAYVQDYADATRFILFNVTGDGIDKGTYWEIPVSMASSGGTVSAGKVAFQSLASPSGTSLFSTTTTAAGLTPGSNGVANTNFLRADGLWAVPAGGGGGGAVQIKEDNVNIITSATGIDFGNGFDVGTTGSEAEISLDLGEYTGSSLPNAKVTGLGSLATKSTIVSADITDGTVALADMANLATDRLIGRQTAGTGVPEAITCTAAGRALIDDADAAAQRVTLGLGNVDNTSDATKATTNAAVTATLTNKTINLANNTVTGTLAQFNTAISDANVPEALNGLTGVWLGTQAQYDAIVTKVATVAYLVTA
jgi:hypothetical protein